ncbi:MAG TPA: L-threonylcarbamoyladenylate synthase [Myxococcota bacterium]
MHTERLTRVDDAVRILRAGGLVAVPSETVYGLAARGLHEEHVRAIFGAKGRPVDNPVILHVLGLDDAWPLWSVDDGARARVELLAGAFWPGPLTLVAPRSALVNDVVTAGLDRVAVRAPSHPLFRAVIAGVGEPIAAPSANASSRPSPTSADDVLASLDGAIDAVLEGGPCAVGIESTVVDVSGPRVRLLRPGAVSAASMRALGLDVEDGPLARDNAAASPGLRHRHYAPRGFTLTLVDDSELARAWDDSAAVLVRASTQARLGARAGLTFALPDDAAGYARELYAALYRLERAAGDDDVTRCLLERVPEQPVWDAVRDRLRRAAGA